MFILVIMTVNLLVFFFILKRDQNNDQNLVKFEKISTTLIVIIDVTLLVFAQF